MSIERIYENGKMSATKEMGLYTSPKESSFKTDSEIKHQLLMKAPEQPPTFNTPLPAKHGWIYWSGRFQDRKKQYIEVAQGEQKHIEISFQDTVCLNLIGDIHAGSAWTDYERIAKEAETIVSTPNSYVLALGDWVDGFFWNPAQMEQVEQAPEQIQYMNSLLEHFASKKRLLIAWGGDHCNWSKKFGSDAFANFSDRFGAYYIYGVGYLTAQVGNSVYKISGAHRHGGSSIYNKAHSAMRLYKDNAEGADIVVTAHTHQKAHLRQTVKEFGGEARKVDYISVGPYKADDDYSRKQGFGAQSPNEMYGSAVILHKNKKKIEYYDDILEANEELVAKLSR